MLLLIEKQERVASNRKKNKDLYENQSYNGLSLSEKLQGCVVISKTARAFCYQKNCKGVLLSVELQGSCVVIRRTTRVCRYQKNYKGVSLSEEL